MDFTPKLFQLLEHVRQPETRLSHCLRVYVNMMTEKRNEMKFDTLT